MSAEDRIRDALGEAHSPSTGRLETRPLIELSGTPEAKIRALEHDVGKLRDALLAAAAEIGILEAKIGDSP
jgi:hypothetical protein